ncbi:MAG: alpha/beta fold hydrolase [Candidatus Tectomicrobia bacterium]|nr:alpha/beta fold hydrolase [Candidatus Tectomicrobia bacterium]
MKIEDVTFPSVGENRVELEGKLHLFEDGERHPAAIVCHPSSHGECDLDHPFVVKVCQFLNDIGVITLRFNFRGVGKSEGALSRGLYESGDVRGALDILDEVGEVNKDALYVMGHSFGAAMAFKAALEDDRIQGAVASGLPIGRVDLPESLYIPYYTFDAEGLRTYKKPKLLIAGSHDDLCPVEQMTLLFHLLPEPKEIEVIQDADHFFRRVGVRGVNEEVLARHTETIKNVLERWLSAPVRGVHHDA